MERNFRSLIRPQMVMTKRKAMLQIKKENLRNRNVPFP